MLNNTQSVPSFLGEDNAIHGLILQPPDHEVRVVRVGSCSVLMKPFLNHKRDNEPTFPYMACVKLKHGALFITEDACERLIATHGDNVKSRLNLALRRIFNLIAREYIPSSSTPSLLNFKDSHRLASPALRQLARCS